MLFATDWDLLVYFPWFFLKYSLLLNLCVYVFVLFLFFIIYLRTHTYEHKLKLLVFLYKGPTKNDTLLQSSYAAADSLLVEVRKMRLKP